MKLNNKNKKSKLKRKIELFGLAFALYMIAAGLVFWIWMTDNTTNSKYSTLILTIKIIGLISLLVGAIALLIATNHLRKWKEKETNDLQK